MRPIKGTITDPTALAAVEAELDGDGGEDELRALVRAIGGMTDSLKFWAGETGSSIEDVALDDLRTKWDAFREPLATVLTDYADTIQALEGARQLVESQKRSIDWFGRELANERQRADRAEANLEQALRAWD